MKSLPKEEDSPLYTPLGYYHPRGGEVRYYLDIRGSVRGFRAPELHGLGVLMEICSDVDHWRGAFPAKSRFKIDTYAAMAYLVEECRRVGWYIPPDDIRPRDVGRPRLRNNSE